MLKDNMIIMCDESKFKDDFLFVFSLNFMNFPLVWYYPHIHSSSRNWMNLVSNE